MAFGYENRDRLTDHFIRHVTEDPFRAPIPAGDNPIKRLAEPCPGRVVHGCDRAISCTTSSLYLCCLAEFVDGENQPIPAGFFNLELFTPAFGKFVELCVTTGFVDIPFGRDPAFLFDTIKSWVQ